MKDRKSLVSRRSMLAISGAVLGSELTRSSTAEAANYWALRHHGNVQVSYWQELLDKYVCADDAGANPLIADRDAIGEWEKFEFILLGGQNIQLKAKVNNKYVVKQADGRLKATGTSSGQTLYVDTSGLTGGHFRLKNFAGTATYYVHLNSNHELCIPTTTTLPAVFLQMPI